MTPNLQRDVVLVCQLLRQLASEEELGLSATEKASLGDVAKTLESCAARPEPPSAEIGRRSEMLRATLWSDGACRGNPGIAGIGAIVKGLDGKVLATVSEYIGTTTNNVAEYRALIRGVEAAKQAGVTVLDVRADSQLMIEQLKGNYAVKNEKLKPLYLAAKQGLKAFDRIDLRHVPRAENSEADELANLGIDSR